MNLNSDFDAEVLLHTDQIDWLASPMPGVDRRMLDRIGDEVARATTIVRYAPGSRFSAHTHSGGEEFIVLEGTFQDEHGDYPTGTYVRNPPTTSHTPGSDEGCTIFVKLWQFDPDDRTQFRKDMAADLAPAKEGVAVAMLHQDPREKVTYTRLDPGCETAFQNAGGTELLVIAGTLTANGSPMRKGSWLRVPDGVKLNLKSGLEGADIWTKEGHLQFATAPTP